LKNIAVFISELSFCRFKLLRNNGRFSLSVHTSEWQQWSWIAYKRCPSPLSLYHTLCLFHTLRHTLHIYSLSHTHRHTLHTHFTYTLSPTHRQTQHTHSLSHMTHIQTIIQTHICKHIHTLTHPHTRSQTHTQTLTHLHTQTHTQIPIHTNTYTHNTHTHTHTLRTSLSLCLWSHWKCQKDETNGISFMLMIAAHVVEECNKCLDCNTRAVSKRFHDCGEKLVYFDGQFQDKSHSMFAGNVKRQHYCFIKQSFQVAESNQSM